MANGASLIAAQSALQALLQGARQNPFSPIGPTFPAPVQTGVDLSPLQSLIGGQGPAPAIPMEPATATPRFAPLPPVEDEISRVLSLLQSLGIGAAPPPPPPASFLQKVALALQGFGAGVQGQGPQFLAGLREERERPAREAQKQRTALIGQIVPDILAARERRTGARETAEFTAERALRLEEFQQGALATREGAKRADARLTLIGNRAAKLGELGVPAEFTQPIAEALSGLRVWTPELIQVYNASVPAKAKADLARTEAETAKTRAEAQLAPLRASQLKAEIGRIGILNRKDLEELNPASNKKVNEIFDFSIRQATAPMFTRVDPVTKQRIEPSREDVLKATNTGRRAAVERLGGDLQSYDRFLQRIDSDPAFARYVNTQRQAGFNDLQILNSNR